MHDWSACPAVERASEKVSGAWLFRGTRVPVKALFENLEGGATVDQFLTWSKAFHESKCSRFWRSPRRAWRRLESVHVPFDQGTPVPLRDYLRGHEVTTAFEME